MKFNKTIGAMLLITASSSAFAEGTFPISCEDYDRGLDFYGTSSLLGKTLKTEDGTAKYQKIRFPDQYHMFIEINGTQARTYDVTEGEDNIVRIYTRDDRKDVRAGRLLKFTKIDEFTYDFELLNSRGYDKKKVKEGLITKTKYISRYPDNIKVGETDIIRYTIDKETKPFEFFKFKTDCGIS